MAVFWKKYGENLYWLVLTAECITHLLPYPALHFITKPLLMPLLISWVYFSTVGPAIERIAKTLQFLLIIALFFAWLGDVLLLFASEGAAFFPLGLVSFLTTHVLYIVFFVKAGARPHQSLGKHLPMLLVVMAYVAGMAGWLWPYLGDLRVAVVVYAIVIGATAYTTWVAQPIFTKAAGRLFVWGILLFVLSDSLLAINKFYTPIPIGGLYIMLWYGMAQAFIVKGFISAYTALK